MCEIIPEVKGNIVKAIRWSVACIEKWHKNMKYYSQFGRSANLFPLVVVLCAVRRRYGDVGEPLRDQRAGQDT